MSVPEPPELTRASRPTFQPYNAFSFRTHCIPMSFPESGRWRLKSSRWSCRSSMPTRTRDAERLPRAGPRVSSWRAKRTGTGLEQSVGSRSRKCEFACRGGGRKSGTMHVAWSATDSQAPALSVVTIQDCSRLSPCCIRQGCALLRYQDSQDSHRRDLQEGRPETSQACDQSKYNHGEAHTIAVNWSPAYTDDHRDVSS